MSTRAPRITHTLTYRIAEREAAKLAAAPDENDLTDFELLRVCLYDIRKHVEKLKVSGALDLRGFLGAKLGRAEFARLFRGQDLPPKQSPFAREGE